MFGHRFAGLFASQSDLQPIQPANFVMCPVGLCPASALAQSWVQEHIYRMAFEQARAVARPQRFAPQSVFSWN